MPAESEEKISEHYCLGDFLVDTTFPELAAQLDPNKKVLENLSRLIVVIDQICDKFPSDFEVLSGYRDERLNDACRAAGLPASLNSMHLAGCAADIRATSHELDLEEVFNWIEKQADTLQVHEAVFYPKKDFIHVAVADPINPSLKRILMRT
jgi:uncharacterized protein YcbK (DUF882 family)